MKKIILIFCALFIISSAWPVLLCKGQAKETTVYIALIKKHLGPRPRNLDCIPSCEYKSSVGILVVNYEEYPGQFMVTVTNDSSGEQWFQIGYSEKIEMGISGDTGYYTIIIETESGDSYFGNFML